MKIKNLIIGACVVASASQLVNASITDTDAAGFLDRGKKLYEIQNYTGAIDQLSQMMKIPASASMMEEADFYIAMCRYNEGNMSSIDILKKFMAKYPTSFHNPEVLFAIGNKYFYNGKYGEAVTNYNLVPQKSLDEAQNADLIYRRGYAELRLGDYDKALNDFNRVANVAKYREAGTFYQGYIEYANGNYDAAMAKFQKVNTRSELGYSAQYYMTQIYFTRGEYDKVVSLGNTLIDANKNPEFIPELYRVVGESYYHMGNDNKAEEYLTKYLVLCGDSNPAQRSAYYVLGVICQRDGRSDDVIRYMNYVTSEDDAMAQSAYLYAGQAYVKSGNNNSAMMAFEKSMQMPFDKNVQETAFYNYAVAQSKGSRTPFSRSIDYFEEFINKYPSSRYQNEVESYLINAYISGNDYQKAMESISHIQKPSSRVLQAKQYVLYNLGINAYSNNQYTKATDYFTQARNLGNFKNGILANCDLWLGDCQYQRGNYQLAEKSYRNFLNSVNNSNPNYYIGYYDLGYAQYQQRNYSGARESFERSVSKSSNLKDSQKADAYNRIGDTHYYSKSFSNAASNYAQALSIHPEGGDYALYQEAMMNGLQKQYSVKIKKLDQLLKEFPNSALSASALFEKGSALLDMNNSDAATQTFEQLLSDFPQSGEARKGLLQLAITLRNEGKQALAITNYRKVISRYPSSEEAALAVEDLKVIYSESGKIDELQNFLSSTSNAPKIDISELDKLTFDAAEKAFLDEKSDISKVNSYIKKYPNGAYIITAKFYVAQDNFDKGKYDTSLEQINEVLSKGADASFAEDALAMKGAILMKKGDNKNSLETYKELSKKATTADNRIAANIGIVRSANELGHYSEVITSANTLLSGSGLSGDEENETRYLRAIAYAATKRGADAEKDWTKLAKDTRNIYGAQSAYKLAEYYYSAGNLKQAEKTLNAFIDEGTPHQYWLARGFILLSDVYIKQGKNFEAREYLESLKSNYPGKDADIFKMIDERLKTLKK